MSGDTQRTLWHLTAAWLRGQEREVGHVANRLAANDMWYVHYHLPETLYPRARFR